jgi:hypothetical protein
MTTTIGIRPVGKTTIIAVTSTASTPVLITTNSNDQINWAEFANTGTVPVAIRIATASTNAVHPVAGTPGDYMLNHDTSIVLAVPTIPYYVSAITVSGTSTLYVTPVDAQ